MHNEKKSRRGEIADHCSIWYAIADKMTSKVNMITVNVPQNCPPSSAGTLIILTLLSALPETRRVDVGLKRRVVGGNSCALRIVRRGPRVFVSNIPIVKSEDPKARSLPSGLTSKQVTPFSPTFLTLISHSSFKSMGIVHLTTNAGLGADFVLRVRGGDVLTIV